MTVASQNTTQDSQCQLVSHVVIIDDGFDIPDFEEARTRITDFLTTLEEHPDEKSNLQDLIGEFNNAEDFTPDRLQTLWENTEKLSPRTKSLVKELFPSLEMLEEMKKFKAVLQSFGYNVDQLGSGCDDNDIKYPDFIFLDYLLLNNDPSRSYEIATNLMKRFKDQDDTNKKLPIIVLMSSDPNIESKAQDFINKTNLIGGNFYIRKKDDLKKARVLSTHLDFWSKMLKERNDLQNYVDKLSGAFLAQSSKLSEKLRALSFEDYVNLQQFYLQKDGHPLGEYLLSLFVDLYESLILEDEDISEAKKTIDAQSYTSGLPYYTAPSETFRHLMQGHTYFKVDEFDPESDDPDKYQLFLGDVFFGGEQIHIICNAECDLSFNKKNKRKRKDKQPILLLRGDLARYTGELPSTPYSYFEKDGTQYSVTLKLNETHSIPYEDVKDWANRSEVKRSFRLKSKPASYFKKTCAEHLFRDGNLVHPPISQSMQIQLKTIKSITSVELETIHLEKDLFCFSWAKLDKDKVVKQILCDVETVVQIAEIFTDKANKLISEFSEYHGDKNNKIYERARKIKACAKNAARRLQQAPTKLLNIEINDGSKEIQDYSMTIVINEPKRTGESTSIFYIQLTTND